MITPEQLREFGSQWRAIADAALQLQRTMVDHDCAGGIVNLSMNVVNTASHIGAGLEERADEIERQR